MNDVTRILTAIEHGDPEAAERLLPLVYDELRKLATQRLAHEDPGQRLQEDYKAADGQASPGGLSTRAGLLLSAHRWTSHQEHPAAPRFERPEVLCHCVPLGEADSKPYVDFGTVGLDDMVECAYRYGASKMSGPLGAVLPETVLSMRVSVPLATPDHGRSARGRIPESGDAMDFPVSRGFNDVVP